MTLNYLLFALYLFLLCWMLLRVPFIKNAGVSGRVLLGLFLCKIIAGIAIGWIAIHMYGPGNDYWDMNDYARDEYRLLMTDPGKYLSNIFTSDYAGGYAGLFNSFNSYWNDLRSNLVIKLVSVFNIFSHGDYYINSLFFNFFVFFGHMALYRLLIQVCPGKKTLVIIGCFLLPSTLYFSSGIHRDGMVFLLLAVLVYSIYQSLKKNRFTKKRLLLIVTSLVFLFLIRSFIFLALVPALVAWILSVKAKWTTGRTFAAVYLFTALLFFTVSSVISKLNPPEIITNKQAEYLNLPAAATQIELTPLEPTFAGFVTHVPEAINHGLLRPYLWEVPVKSLIPLCIELFVYQLLLVLFIFFKRKEVVNGERPFLCFALFFTFSVYLLIGYIVPNLGSLVRYRSLYLPLIITPLLAYLDWNKLAGLIKITKK